MRHISVKAEPAATVVSQCAYCLAAFLSLLSARLDFVVSNLKDQLGMQEMRPVANHAHLRS